MRSLMQIDSVSPLVPRQQRVQRPLRTFAITSGKGGVGKTNLCASLAVAMARSGARVLTLDGDLGKANLDIVMGVIPGRSLLDMVSGECSVEDVLVRGPEGVSILPACSGRYDLANIGDDERHMLFGAIDELESNFDVLLVDTAAGITSNAVAFAAATREVVLVATPEPTSIADAYAMTKVLAKERRVRRVRVLANMVSSPRQGERVFQRLAHLVDRFLDVGVDYLGFVYRDEAVTSAVERRRPFLIAEPDAPASRSISAIASKLTLDAPSVDAGGIQLFWRRLVGATEVIENLRAHGASR